MWTFIFLSLIYNYPKAQCQFPQHIDFQKISEITFKNEKYNVLKPTIHIVRDHFEDVMLRRNTDFPTNRLFMDKNSFRHFWKGMELKPNLRKNIHRLDIDKAVNTTKITKKRPIRKKKVIEKIFVPNIKPKTLREGKGTLVKTTFFCPFFGVLTMFANVNLDLEENKPE